MADLFETFVASLDGGEPPGPALLRALWHGLRGEWEPAHEIAQAHDDADAAWVHAWLHRIEGDLGNADYWYRRATRPARRDATRDEGLAIARVLLRTGADEDR